MQETMATPLQLKRAISNNKCCAQSNERSIVMKVRFHLVEIIELPLILGDNPACSGAPLACGWDVISRQTMSFLSYEKQRPKRRRRSRQLLVPSRLRFKLLRQMGYGHKEIEQVIGINERIQLERMTSIQQSEAAAVDIQHCQCLGEMMAMFSTERPAMCSSSLTLSSSSPESSYSSSSSTVSPPSSPEQASAERLRVPTRRGSLIESSSCSAEPLTAPTRRGSILGCSSSSSSSHQPLYCPTRRGSMDETQEPFVSNPNYNKLQQPQHHSAPLPPPPPPHHRQLRRASDGEFYSTVIVKVDGNGHQISRRGSDGDFCPSPASRRGSITGSQPLQHPTRRGSITWGAQAA